MRNLTMYCKTLSYLTADNACKNEDIHPSSNVGRGGFLFDFDVIQTYASVTVFLHINVRCVMHTIHLCIIDVVHVTENNEMIAEHLL